MGFFSFYTQDTDESIANVHSDRFEMDELTMHDDKGNQYKETAYQGYGIFGGVDFFVLSSEMNGVKGDFDAKRSKGIEMYFDASENDNEKKHLFPMLTRLFHDDVKKHDFTNVPTSCENQGYFY